MLPQDFTRSLLELIPFVSILSYRCVLWV